MNFYFSCYFAGFDGSVYDYFFGYEDLQKRRVAFVGDADIRIKEDYLRIMRYFRFYGKIAEEPDKHEEKTLQCIRENVEGLQNISGERIWVELKKLLQGNFAGSLLKTMIDVGIGKYIGLYTMHASLEIETCRLKNQVQSSTSWNCKLAILCHSLEQKVSYVQCIPDKFHQD